MRSSHFTHLALSQCRAAVFLLHCVCVTMVTRSKKNCCHELQKELQGTTCTNVLQPEVETSSLSPFLPPYPSTLLALSMQTSRFILVRSLTSDCSVAREHQISGTVKHMLLKSIDSDPPSLHPCLPPSLPPFLPPSPGV